MLGLLTAYRASGFDNTQLATAMAFQNCAISIQQLPLRVFRTHIYILIWGLRTFALPNVVLVHGLQCPRLVPVGITFLKNLSTSGRMLAPNMTGATRLAIERLITGL